MMSDDMLARIPGFTGTAYTAEHEDGAMEELVLYSNKEPDGPVPYLDFFFGERDENGQFIDRHRSF